MLHKLSSKAVETVQDQEQQATGEGVDTTSSEAEEEAESVPLPASYCLELKQHETHRTSQY